jgi:hypothetical protein
LQYSDIGGPRAAAPRLPPSGPAGGTRHQRSARVARNEPHVGHLIRGVQNFGLSGECPGVSRSRDCTNMHDSAHMSKSVTCLHSRARLCTSSPQCTAVHAAFRKSVSLHLLYRRNKTAGTWAVRVVRNEDDWVAPRRDPQTSKRARHGCGYPFAQNPTRRRSTGWPSR